MPGQPPPELQTDFVSGAVAWRRHHGGGRGQLLAKAVGLRPGVTPTVLDATAGLGKDAFVLATLGCTLLLLERHPSVYRALQDGLDRARDHALHTGDTGLQAILERLTLIHADARDWLLDPASAQRFSPDVIYLDPMFPERQKSAAVKKAMVAMQQQVGDDADSPELLARALATPARRIVVKRPKGAAPLLAEPAPTLVMRGASCRFDVYPRVSLGPR